MRFRKQTRFGPDFAELRPLLLRRRFRYRCRLLARTLAAGHNPGGLAAPRPGRYIPHPVEALDAAERPTKASDE
jgi:hypothetical protein